MAYLAGVSQGRGWMRMAYLGGLVVNGSRSIGRETYALASTDGARSRALASAGHYLCRLRHRPDSARFGLSSDTVASKCVSGHPGAQDIPSGIIASMSFPGNSFLTGPVWDIGHPSAQQAHADSNRHNGGKTVTENSYPPVMAQVESVIPNASGLPRSFATDRVRRCPCHRALRQYEAYVTI